MSDIVPVALVGAGPGDPDLLTVKALKRLQEADVVVYDRLVAPAVLALVPPGTARIFVGKQAGQHSLPQDEINDLLVRLARKGRRVVRLKGGDPFIFGRGSEEALVLASQGVPFEIVPGITAAAGIGAEVGIPLTHRGLATGFRVVTGHCREDAELDLDWQGLADPQTTVVFYMSLANLRQISSHLIAAGRAPQTPVAAISCGTTPNQAQCLTTLARLPEAVVKAGLKAPTLLIVGEVASLARDLNWRALRWIVDEAENADSQANA